MSRCKIIIFDIDGTLADTDHRVHHVRPEEGKKKDWSAFFAEAKKDMPHIHVVNILKMYEALEYTVVLCTGRPSNLRNDTVDWLNKHSIPYHVLLMRLSTDRGPDVEAKKEILLSWLKNNNIDIAGVEAVFEDRIPVANMWREMGLPVFLCGDEWR